jgi:hypothetical protein
MTNLTEDIATTKDGIAAVELRRPAAAAAAMPVMDLDTAFERREAIRAFIARIMTPGEDFGTIPGTGSKPVLLKSGSEKLCSFFGLAPEFDVTQRIEKWDDKQPFFHYEVKCRLVRDGVVRGEGLGSCNSREAKYRWRQAERLCPKCGRPAIIRGKEEYGGGWLCFNKKGGCGAKYQDGDSRIEGQETGRIPNPDIADAVNIILKMSKKRALIDAVLNTVGASQFFTQDVEDLPSADRPAAPPSSPEAVPPELAAILDRMRDRQSIGTALRGLLEDLAGRTGEGAATAEFQRRLKEHGVAKWEDLRSVKAAKRLAADLYAVKEQAPAGSLPHEPEPDLFDREPEARYAE